MSFSTKRSERFRPLSKRQRVEEDDEPEHKDTVLINILKQEKKRLADENEALKQRLKEAQNATSLETNEKDALTSQNIRLKASLNSATQDAKLLRSQLGEAKKAKKRCHDATSKELSAEHSPMLHLAKVHDRQIVIPIKDHAQVTKDILPLVSPGNQEHTNHLLDFVFFGVNDEWVCFRASCEKKVTDDDVYKNHQCPVHKTLCKLWMRRVEASPHDKIFFHSL